MVGTRSGEILVRLPHFSRKCPIRLATESLFFIPRTSVLLLFFCFLLFFNSVLECVARRRAALLGSAPINFSWFVDLTASQSGDGVKRTREMMEEHLHQRPIDLAPWHMCWGGVGGRERRSKS